MTFDAQRLYELLPAIYRIRDAEQGSLLRAFMHVIADEVAVLEEDLAQLYDDQFIETCADWVIPYIGDLLSVRALHDVRKGTPYSQRAWVANTIRYRRRKGTLAVLEQLALDVTGWSARAVEFFQQLGTTQFLNHLRPGNIRTPDLRDLDALERLDGPFDQIAHTVDVRPITPFEGKYNIPNIGLFLWRLQSYYVSHSNARVAQVEGVVQPGCYTFSPLGQDAPLFTLPETERELSHIAEEINVPTPIRRGAFYRDLEGYWERYKTIPLAQRPPNTIYYGSNHSLHITRDGQEVLPSEVMGKDLNHWERPPSGMVAIDVTRGRLAFADGVTPGEVLVSYTYGFSGEVGGGPYDRQNALIQAGLRQIDWQVGVSKAITAVGSELIFPTLQAAIQAWNSHAGTQPTGTVGAIVLLDSRTYAEDLDNVEIQIPPRAQLLIVAANWAAESVSGSSGQIRRVGQLQVTGQRPHLQLNLVVRGTVPDPNPASSNSEESGELLLNGLLLEGQLTVLPGNLNRLRLDHCTLVPDQGGLEVKASESDGQNDDLTIAVNRCICGPVQLSDAVPVLQISDSIISSGKISSGKTPVETGVAIAAPVSDVNIQSSTIFGKTASVRTLEASNSLFTAEVKVTRCQTGCVRFSYVPESSRVPRRYRCQPQLAIEQRARVLKIQSLSDAERNLIVARVQPQFTSERYGQPAYAQLSWGCAEEIRMGAEDGSEMGVFCYLQQPQRESNLRVGLDEYLRFGLEAGIIYVT
jgi:hypothetical protein